MLAPFLDDITHDGVIVPKRMAQRLHVAMTQMAKLANVSRTTLNSKATSPIVQKRLGDIAHIIAKAAELSGDEGRAVIWFRHQPIAAFGSTAEKLVEDGHGDLVVEHLERMAAGVYS